MARKTVTVDDVKKTANRILRSDDSIYNSDYRRGIADLLENILFQTNNYHGFNYLETEKVYSDDGKLFLGLRDGYDTTRRFYY